MDNDNLIIKPKHPKGEDGYKTFSIRIREEIVARLEEVAGKSARSRNEIISIFLEYALDRCIVEKPED